MGLKASDALRWIWVMLVAGLFMIPYNVEAKPANLSRYTLSNGLEVMILEDHTRKVATLQYWVLVGSADEEEPERGISHLIEHMAFKGTQRRGVGKIASEVESLGGEMNAYTSWDETVFHVTVPSRAILQGLDIITDAVLNPVIDPGELDKEKQVVIEEILEGEERPNKKASKLLFETAYTASPYKYPIIGYKKTVEGFTRDNVISFRKKWYVPENMFLLIVGDVDPTALRPEIERLTANFKPTGFFRAPRAQEPVQKKIRDALLRDKNAREARLLMAFHIPSLKGADVNALDLAASILGGRESSRLVRVLKKEKQLVNSISSHALTPKEPGLFFISATLSGTNLEAATKAIMEEIRQLDQTAPSAEELKRAKTDIESDHLYARETVEGLARSMGSFKATIDDALYEEKYLRLNAATTAQEVSEAVRRYLVPPNVTVTVLMPEGDAKEFQIARLAEIVGEFKPKKTKDAEEATAEGVIIRTLPNGIRVVLMPDDSNPIVSFRVASLGGKRFETKQTEGISNFIAQMVTKGTSAMSELDINRKIEDMGGRLSGFSGYDSFGLSASFFGRYVDQGLDMLSQIYTDASFPQEILDRERALIINQIKTQPDRPVPFALNQLNETFFGSHPYGFNKEGTLESVAGFTRDDLIHTYRRLVVPANTVITGVGDMDVVQAMQRITELFGKIPAKQFDPPPVPAEKPLKQVKEKTVKIPRAKAHLVVGFGGSTFKDEDRYPLAVLNNALAGQGGRLFFQLRDKESLAYIVTSMFRPGMDPGLFAFYIACDASKIDQAVQSLFREIREARQNPLSDEELNRSKENLIGNHLINLQSSWSRAENTVLNTLYGLGYDYDKIYIKRLSEVKADQVLAVAKKYLDPDRCAIVKILPEENEK
jgi:zinc protease